MSLTKEIIIKSATVAVILVLGQYIAVWTMQQAIILSVKLPAILKHSWINTTFIAVLLAMIWIAVNEIIRINGKKK